MKLGNFGEDLALKYMMAKGYKPVIRNFRFNRAEIDLIMKNETDKLLVFTEVKTRRNRKFGEPEEGVTERKTGQIYKSAEGFLAGHPEFNDYTMRFDIVSIIIENGKSTIKHIENAF
jgi:putative endonuclease